jgi:hypothetical protein
MKYALTLIGFIIIAFAATYFIQLYNLPSDSYEFSNYGLGILAGKSLLLIFGGFLLILGIKRIRAKKA